MAEMKTLQELKDAQDRIKESLLETQVLVAQQAKLVDFYLLQMANKKTKPRKKRQDSSRLDFMSPLPVHNKRRKKQKVGKSPIREEAEEDAKEELEVKDDKPPEDAKEPEAEVDKPPINDFVKVYEPPRNDFDANDGLNGEVNDINEKTDKTLTETHIEELENEKTLIETVYIEESEKPSTQEMDDFTTKHYSFLSDEDFDYLS